ncbi:MAG: hypothetical protein IJP62_05725 [Treponema sp.]|nr:hypothetical protein [Treponema sp.]
MSKLTDQPKREKRVNVSLTPDLKEKLSVLAAIDQTTPTALAGRILSDYVTTREEEFEAYTRSLKQIRSQYAK